MTNIKILLINPNRIKPPVNPLGLISLIRPLKKKGYKVKLLDLCFSTNTKKDIKQALEYKPDYIGISIRNIDDGTFCSKKFFLEKTKKIVNQIKQYTDAEVIAGGPGYSVQPEGILKYLDINYGIIGPGEKTFIQLLEALSTDTSLKKISGLSYKEKNTYKTNPVNFLIHDEPSKPNRNLIDNRRYVRFGGMSNIQTKRGCAYNCIFCVNPNIEGRTKLKDPKVVVEELEELTQLRVNYVHFTDSTFNIPEEHAKQVCREIIKSGLNKEIKWTAYTSPKPFSDELAYLMKQAGCDALTFGIDTANDELIRKWGKFFTKKDILCVSQLCNKYKISFMHNLLLGGPGETLETIKESYDLMRQCNPTLVGVMYGMRIYPNTPLANLVMEEGLNQNNTNLYGTIKNNQSMLYPLFYVSNKIGKDIGKIAYELAEGDDRFLIAGYDRYPYNDKTLTEAYKKGFRGPFWKACKMVSK